MHPVAFTIPGIDLPIFSYGMMLALSLIVGWNIVMRLGAKDGLPKDRLMGCFVVTAIAALFGSRLLYIVTNPSLFYGASLGTFLDPRGGGIVAYGGFLGGFVGSWIYLRRARIRLLPWADVVVPTLAAGLGITRIGCFLFGCDYGRPIPADAPGFVRALGVRFPNWDVQLADLKTRLAESSFGSAKQLDGAPAFLHHVHDGLVRASDAWSALVYPTQLMEVLNGWIAFAITMIVRRRTRFRGQVFLVFTMYYGATRAAMELLRGDVGRGGLGPLSTSQIIGIATLIAAAIAYYVLAKRAALDPVAAMALGPGASPAPVKPKRKR
ncbi:MAG: prolipoprotein diacylglyceryl transferase [Proteobacteria bacterium]|jgi:phosphatidylglycerol:prolipoprotein diacylglycerol transferase|nr:prolipoprotein diacylglyceryl transferase [Pseudomonadota bacterium]